MIAVPRYPNVVPLPWDVEPLGVTSPEATLSSQATLPFGHSAMRDNFALGHSANTQSRWNLHVASGISAKNWCLGASTTAQVVTLKCWYP